MATGTNDYGIAVYNQQGINVLGNNLFLPKLIGTLTLRQRSLGVLSVVAADGTELSEHDASRNVPLTALRADGIADAYSQRDPHPYREGGEVYGELTHKYEFALHGGNRSLPLLAAVIHGWGKAYDAAKFDLASRLVKAVLPGQDWQLATQLMYGDRVAEEIERESRLRGQHSGLPCAMTFRCHPLGEGVLDGFGLVTIAAGRLYVEMTPNTEIVLHLYDWAGVPWDYFARASTVETPDEYGLAVYGYELPLTKVVWTGETAESYGKPLSPSPLHMASMPRARYFFTRGSNTLGNIVNSIDNEDTAARRYLCQKLEDDPNAPLRYELYNNARPLLRLLSNQDSVRKGRQVSVRDVGSIGKVYTVQAGHDYSKVCSMAHHACGGMFDLSGGGVLNGIGNVHAHSVFERSLGNTPSRVRPANLPDDYAGAPWNPTVPFKLSQMYAATGLDYHAPNSHTAVDALLRDVNVLDKFNLFVHQKTWKLQRALNVVFKIDTTVAHLPNPDYSPEEAAKRLETMQAYQSELREEQARRELNGGGYDVDIHAQIHRDLGGRKALLDMIESVVDGGDRYRADLLPFWGLPAYRHSGDRIELYQHLSVKSSGKANAPEYLPENWILCRTPD